MKKKEKRKRASILVLKCVKSSLMRRIKKEFNDQYSKKHLNFFHSTANLLLL